MITPLSLMNLPLLPDESLTDRISIAVPLTGRLHDQPEKKMGMLVGISCGQDHDYGTLRKTGGGWIKS